MADFAESSHACERCSTIDRSLRRIDEDLSTIGFGGSLAELLPRFCSRRDPCQLSYWDGVHSYGKYKANASGTSGMGAIMGEEAPSPLHLSLFWHTLRRAKLMNCVVYPIPLSHWAGHWSITKPSRGSGEESLEPSEYHPVIADWPSRMWPCDPPACHQKARERRDVAELRYSVRRCEQQSTIADGLPGSAQKEPSPWEELKSALDALVALMQELTKVPSAGIWDERRGLCADERGVAYPLQPMGGHASLVFTLLLDY
ncbi:hypothetical protein BO79DRAFT_234513 [Aspergillus costaricaensis CBS 115574]|uniref:Uncharacterized protein n=1 Tax=Aspergillus costaricaensis CBS 115574 TaxID=1448317 RepID=A0ACD1IS23_9EURO|nr:hypothetical protein BO79DRAFT_234513 [Aspergillus costaricaensis CBS 115574]RAK93508.1 hypothetical protein BO79DRAFT_234513 [Aspergillus costaricaensis CBS 115574]